jgi:hypothetical protein
MTIQMSTTLRNARLDQIETTIGVSAVLKIFTGAQPATCATADSGTKLAEYDLASDWAAAASAGAKALSGTPITVAGAGTGTAGYFRIYDSTATTCHMQGTVGTAGADMIIDNTSVITGQNVVINSLSFTEPGA